MCVADELLLFKSKEDNKPFLDRQKSVNLIWNQVYSLNLIQSCYALNVASNLAKKKNKKMLGRSKNG